MTLLLNLLVKPASLLVESLTHNEIDHEQWAIYTSLFSFAFIFSVFSDFGINQLTTKTIANSTDNFKKDYPSLFFLKIILSGSFPFLMLIPGYLIGYRGIELEFLFWISLTHGLIHVMSFFRANIQGFQLFKIDAFVSNFDKLFFILFLLVLYFTNYTSVQQVINARLASMLLTLIAIGILLYKNNAWLRPIKPTYKNALSLLKQSMPFAFIIVLYSMNERIDQVMIERLSPLKSDASIYAAAYRWLDAAMMYLWIILPLFFARFSYQDITIEAKKKLLTAGLGLTSIPLIVVCIFSIFHGQLLFLPFTNSSPSEIELMNSCFQILSIALLLQGCFAILSTYLTSNNETSSISYLLGLSILINIVLNYYFIPTYGALAASYTTLISTLVLSLGYVIVFIIKKPFTLPYLSWLKIAVIFTGAYYLGFWIDTYDLQWYLFLPIIGLAVLLAGLGTKLIDLSVLKNND